MDRGQNVFRDFIMERAQEGKQEEVSTLIEETFKPPKDGDFGNFNPEEFKKKIEKLTALLKPEAVPEFQKMMNPFGGRDENREPPEIKNALAQPDCDRWKDDDKDVTKEAMKEAFACSKRAQDMKCDCWNTHCTFFGQCNKCIVFHLLLKQFPTCQRQLLGELEDHYIIFSQDK